MGRDGRRDQDLTTASSPATSDRAAAVWRIATIVVFGLLAGFQLLEGLILPAAIGSHAAIYTEATRVWLAGGDPWTVGPPAAVFAGPPPMLLLFVPFVPLPSELTRLIWVGGSLVLAIWTIRRLGLPGYWVGFPPIFQAIFLGHPEVLMLWLLIFGGAVAGLGAAIKPYVGLPLLAERRWTAFAVGAVALAVTLPILPWGLFIQDLPMITANLVRQSHGDSVFGSPVLMVVAVVALGALGLRRGLWLAGPVLWPSAQPIYKTVTTPALSPAMAILWSIPVPGFTLGAVILEGIALRVAERRPLPGWLAHGFGLAATAGPLSRPLAPLPLALGRSPLIHRPQESR